MRWILVPCVTNNRVSYEVKKTFDDNVETRVCQLCAMVVTNYSSEKLINSMYKEICLNVDMVSSQLQYGDEVYVLFSGGIIHSYVAACRLNDLGVDWDILIFERKKNKDEGGCYAILKEDVNGFLVR